MNYPRQTPASSTKAISKNQPALTHETDNKKIENQVIVTEPSNKAAKITTPKTEPRIADNYRENLSFEKIIGATRHDGAFRLVAPAIGAQFSEKAKIVFKWTTEKQAGIELNIMDNAGSVFTNQGRLIKANYFGSGKLNKGLYYYKVMEKDEITFRKVHHRIII